MANRKVQNFDRTENAAWKSYLQDLGLASRNAFARRQVALSAALLNSGDNLRNVLAHGKCDPLATFINGGDRGRGGVFEQRR